MLSRAFYEFTVVGHLLKFRDFPFNLSYSDMAALCTPCITFRCASRPDCSHNSLFIVPIMSLHSLITWLSRRHFPSLQMFSRSSKELARPAVSSISLLSALSVAFSFAELISVVLLSILTAYNNESLALRGAK